MKKITLVVQSEASKYIVQMLLRAANYPVQRIEVIVVEDELEREIIVQNGLYFTPSQRTISDHYTVLLLDSNKLTIPDALASESLSLQRKGVDVFFAVPAVEAWVFADIEPLKAIITTENTVDTLQRLPLPEEIPYPRQVISNLLRNEHNGRYGFLINVDIKKASARSFSLNYFLNGIAKLLEIKNHLETSSMATNLDRRIFANLIKEVVPSDAVIYRTLDGNKVTASQMLNNIEEGNDLGQQYTSELLRIARDFLRRQANK